MLTAISHVRTSLGTSLLILAAAFVSAASGETVQRPGLAVAGFDFRDTSGEVWDQRAEHMARMADLVSTLRREFSASVKVGLVELACQADGCSGRRTGLDVLSADAVSAGARYLLIGEVHKTSTLVGWVKFAVLDLGRRKATCDRFLTYRGDTDEAWHRAAEFAVQDIERNCIPRP